ncbi:MAG: hypothetical protein ACRDU8_01430 [Egibacteraceae bacterium]
MSDQGVRVDGDRQLICDLVVEACALVEWAERHGLDDATWSALQHLRAELCWAVDDTRHAEDCDAACGMLASIDEAVVHSSGVAERGAA